MVHRLLSNPYYTGKVRHGGVIYDGKHQPLIDETTFQAMKAVRANRRLAGERACRRQQYLKGSVFCDGCGDRLGYGHSTGRGGEYPYFFCPSRHCRRTDCDLPYMNAEQVEVAVQRVWSAMKFSPELVELLTGPSTKSSTLCRLGTSGSWPWSDGVW